jgi:organic hydroperoxide reductase OsmC/OhrA
MSVHQKLHSYRAKIEWTGNTGEGTSNYRAYQRSHEITIKGKPVILGSSDPAFRGEASRHNPEELLLASLSSCHMLWFLHLCADHKVIVTGYVDRAEGTMVETEDGSGHFTEVVLKPEVTARPGADVETLRSLHKRAHKLCFIANSVNFPIHCQDTLKVEEQLHGKI